MPGASRFVAIAFIVVLSVGIYSLTAKPEVLLQVIRVQSVSSDLVDAQAGDIYYLLSVNVTNQGSFTWPFNPSFLRVTSNLSQTYSPDNNYNYTTLMGESDVAPRSSAHGVVVFELPSHEGPMRVTYDNPSSSANVAGVLPPVSSHAVRLTPNLQIDVNGIPVSPGVWTPSSCPTTTVNGTGPWICSVVYNGVALNATLFSRPNCPVECSPSDFYIVLFTGQSIQVNLWFEYLKHPSDPTTVTLQSVGAGTGFQLLSVQGAIPQTLSGWGAQGGLTVTLKILPSAQSGRITMSEEFSA